MLRSRGVILATAVLLCLGFVTTGCTDAPGVQSTTPRSQIRISGSGTTLPLMHVLTDAYPGDVDFVYLPGLHSGGGVEGAYRGDLELGVVSRALEGDETGYGLELTVLSTDALAIAVHPTVDVDGITAEQLRAVYAGEIVDWSELGGSLAPIVVLDRPEDESAKKVLRRDVLGDDFEVTPGAIQLYYEGDMVDAVASTPYSIGYFSLGNGVSQGADVRYLALDGVEPSVDNTNEGSYTMTRDLGVVWRPDAPQEVRDFLTWAASEEAVDLLAENGFAARRVQ